MMKASDDITKSSRHQKIIGQFGEQIVCNWLSRSGFEVAIVDHTGLDIIAYRPDRKQRLGITVKARTRSAGTEAASVRLFSAREEGRKKLVTACNAFGCEPWIAVYVEASNDGDIFLTSLAHYDEAYRGRSGRENEDWKMGPEHRKRYETDTGVKHLHVRFDKTGWRWK
jgi:hypothetical protein